MRRRSRSRSIVATAAVATLPLVASCGVPTGPESLQPIEDEVVPNRLAEPSTSVTTTTTTTTTTVAPDSSDSTTMPPPAPAQVVIYFLSRGELRGVELAAPSFPPQPSDLIQLLENGPGDPFSDLFENEIVEGLIVSTSVESGVVTIELDPDLFGEIDEVAQQRAAIAQMVLTFLGNLQFVGQARFAFDGETIRVPTGDSGFTDQPVSLDDYSIMLADRGTAPAGDEPVGSDPAAEDPAPEGTPPTGTVG